MLAKEKEELIRLRAENAELKSEIEKHMVIYQNKLYEIVDIKTKLKLITYIINAENQE